MQYDVIVKYRDGATVRLDPLAGGALVAELAERVEDAEQHNSVESWTIYPTEA